MHLSQFVNFTFYHMFITKHEGEKNNGPTFIFFLANG